MRLLLSLLLLGFLHPAFSQPSDIIKVRNGRQHQEQAIVSEFVSFLSIPDIAADSINIQKNAAFIRQMMSRRKIGNVRMLTGKDKRFPPAVYGEVLVPGARQTIGFYAHYDGQPVNPAQWAKGLEPFRPVLFDGSLLDNGKPIPFPADRGAGVDGGAGVAGTYKPEWRIYGRAASDDKAGVTAILNAYEALTANGIKPACNIKFLFEGEENAGSVSQGGNFSCN